MATDKFIQKDDPKTKRIIFADDDDHIRDLVEKTLSLEGFQVKTTRDGRNILKLALDFQPNLILTDLMMPGGGGYELLRSLQSDELTRKIPVIMITGHMLDKTAQNEMKQEPNLVGYLQKPIFFPAFLLKVHEILNTKSKEEKMIDDMNKNDPHSDINMDRYGF